MLIKNNIELLGYKVKDKVTGFKGVIDSVSFDIYGCVQVCIKPKMQKDGEVPQGYWFDVTRLEIDQKSRVVDMPNFYEEYIASGKKGPADKPASRA